MYTVSDIVEIGDAKELILSSVKQIAQQDDDNFLTQSAEEFDE